MGTGVGVIVWCEYVCLCGVCVGVICVGVGVDAGLGVVFVCVV